MAARVVLVRHGRAEAGWGEHADPGLDAEGGRQAEELARALAPSGPMPILVSPLRRARETAEPLEAAWGVRARVEAAVGEMPSPTDDLAARGRWLEVALRGRWSDLGSGYVAWRDRVAERIAAIDVDTVVVSHFVLINAAVGAATRDDRLVCFRPGYCSRTVLEVDGGAMRVVSLGGESRTRVL